METGPLCPPSPARASGHGHGCTASQGRPSKGKTPGFPEMRGARWAQPLGTQQEPWGQAAPGPGIILEDTGSWGIQLGASRPGGQLLSRFQSQFGTWTNQMKLDAGSRQAGQSSAELGQHLDTLRPQLPED